MSAMGRIRPFAEDDIPQVAALHVAAFRRPGPLDLEGYRRYFTDTFVQHPFGSGALPSLVYEEEGRILGFLGLVGRRVSLDGQRFDALVSSQFVVDPRCAAGLVALRLAKAYLSGPQDLSIADEANEVSRRIWEGLGGATALLLSMYWTRALRPAQLAVGHLRARPRAAAIAALARPFAKVTDALVGSRRARYFRPAVPAAPGEDLTGDTVVAHAAAVCGRGAVRVDYDARGVQWLLQRAARGKAGRRLLKAVLRRGEKVLGWYIGRLGDDGVVETLQLAATPASVGDVLDQLFHRAWRHGAVAVTGRLEPRFLQALSDRYCVFHRRGPWVLFHSTRPRLVEAFHAGEACLSRLDGEWSLRFLPSLN